MFNGRVLMIPFVVLSLVFVLSACSNSDEENSGVARIDTTKISNATADEEQLDNEGLTDEKIVTLFVSCLRDNGVDMIDPELNSDGTVRWESVKRPLAEAGFNLKNDRDNAAYEECSPLLGRFTQTDENEKEDEIEMQDKTLIFAQCLRDNGLEVPDPDFSEGSRSGMKPMLAEIKGTESRVEEITEKCIAPAYGASGMK